VLLFWEHRRSASHQLSKVDLVHEERKYAAERGEFRCRTAQALCRTSNGCGQSSQSSAAAPMSQQEPDLFPHMWRGFTDVYDMSPGEMAMTDGGLALLASQALAKRWPCIAELRSIAGCWHMAGQSELRCWLWYSKIENFAGATRRGRGQDATTHAQHSAHTASLIGTLNRAHSH
jgi:hypothetical protein